MEIETRKILNKRVFWMKGLIREQKKIVTVVVLVVVLVLFLEEGDVRCWYEENNECEFYERLGV